MERKLATVSNSIEFRDVVMTADREGRDVHVRLHGLPDLTYRILPRHADPFQKITIDRLFSSFWPPVYMEDFAQALIASTDTSLRIDVFTMDVP